MQETELKKILILMGIDLNNDKTFIIAGGMNDYTNKEGKLVKGLKTLILEGAEDEIYKKHKERIGRKLYTYNEATKSVNNGFCSRIGLWIPKDYIVIDTDTKEESIKMLQYIEENEIETPIFKTNHGYHFIFKNTIYDGKQDIGLILNNGVKCDYRLAGKGYIILPYNDKNREVYSSPDSIEYIRNSLLPLDEKKKKKTEKKTELLIKKIGDSVPEGLRNDSTFRELCKLIANNSSLREEKYISILAHGINAKNNPPLSDDEIETIVKSALTYADPSYIRNGYLVPSVLAEQIYTDTKIANYKGLWFNYNGKYYEAITDENKPKQHVIDYLENYPTAIKTHNINETLNLLEIQSSFTEINEKYIAVNNGLVNLDTFKLEPFSEDTFVTFGIDIDYNEDMMNDDIFDSFEFMISNLYKYLNTTFTSYRLRRVVQELIGMTLQPNPKKFQRTAALLGKGSNGKSLFINLIYALHGGNVSSVPMKSIYSEKEQNFQIYNLVGKKVNLDPDATSTRIIESSNFKKLTTADVISIEKKGEQAQTAIIKTVLIYGINEMPSSSDTSYGFVRRQLIIPFTQTFIKPSEKNNDFDKVIDYDLEDNIINNEMHLLFIFALQGLKRLKNNNYEFTECDEVKEAIEENRKEIDSVYAFNVARSDGDTRTENISGKNLYNIYKMWCEDNEKNPVNQTTFGRRFKSLNPDIEAPKKHGVIIYNKVKLLDEFFKKRELWDYN